jgi:hypothetical protein
MEIKQLNPEQIEQLKERVRTIRDQIQEGVRTNNNQLDYIELSYQATRLQTWIRVQEGSNDQLKNHLLSYNPRSVTRTTTKRRESKNLQLKPNNGGVRYYLPEGPQYHPQQRRAQEQIFQRSRELKQMPKKLNFSR